VKRLAALACLSVFLTLPSCGVTKNTIVDDVIPQATDIALDCARGSVHDIAVGLLDDVASALAGGNWIGLLKELAARWGYDALDCAVREVASTSWHAAQVSGDDTQNTKAARGKQWLAARGRSQ
jgi:hypothetical protein